MDMVVQQETADSTVKECHLRKADTERRDALDSKEEDLNCIDPLKKVHRNCEFKSSVTNFVILMALTT